MAKYLVLIYEAEGERTGQRDPEYDRHRTFMQEHKDRIVAGEALQQTSTATSLRTDGPGTFTVADGPFVETKEAIGGFYLLEAADLDMAIELAKQVPAPAGGLEIRPVMVFG